MSASCSPFQGSFLSLQTVNDLTWFSVKHKFVYIETPKCGCTHTISHLCSYVSRQNYFPIDIHSIRDSLPLQKPLKDLTSLNSYVDVISRDSLIFTVVRDPMQRFLSGYADKFLLNPDPYIWKSMGFATEESTPTPLEVMTRVMNTKRYLLDIHFQPICDLIKPFRGNINTFVRLESLSGFLDNYFKCEHNSISRRNRALSQLSEPPAISDELIRKCIRFYSRDYQLLETRAT